MARHMGSRSVLTVDLPMLRFATLGVRLSILDFAICDSRFEESDIQSASSRAGLGKSDNRTIANSSDIHIDPAPDPPRPPPRPARARCRRRWAGCAGASRAGSPPRAAAPPPARSGSGSGNSRPTARRARCPARRATRTIPRRERGGTARRSRPPDVRRPGPPAAPRSSGPVDDPARRSARTSLAAGSTGVTSTGTPPRRVIGRRELQFHRRLALVRAPAGAAPRARRRRRRAGRRSTVRGVLRPRSSMRAAREFALLERVAGRDPPLASRP